MQQRTNNEGLRFWGAVSLSIIVLLAVVFGLYRLLSSLVLIPSIVLAVFTFYALAHTKHKSFVLAGPEIRFGRRRFVAFRMCACVGLAIGIAINIGMALHQNLSFLTSILVSFIGLALIPVVAMVGKIISGEEQLCFYYHLIAVLAITAAVLMLLGQPILPFLDMMILAIGAARAFGYFGCLTAGCCHGRPSRWGVVYRRQYANALPDFLFDVPLFPIQIFEGISTFGIVVVGCVQIFNQNVPGTGFAWFIATYCTLRFCFECLRWPPNYQFKSGLSQHQWISLCLLLLLISLETTNVLQFHFWHVLVLMSVLLGSAVLVIERRLRTSFKQMNHPEHLREVSTAIDAVKDTGCASFIPITHTSLGLQITAGKINSAKGEIYHYALSCPTGLNEETVRSLAETLLGTQSSNHPIEVLAGNRGVFHLLFHPTPGEAS